MALFDKFSRLNDLFEEVQDFDINELSFDNIGTWPDFVKIAIFILTFGVVIVAGHQLIVSDLVMQKEREERRETQLKQAFSQKAFLAANLNAYRMQMQEMKESFGALVSQLPSDTEVPGLLEDITKKGEVSGLEIKSIDLDNEVSKEFYVELPIDIVVQGSYHDMGAFVSGVASLPRIVTLTDFTIKPRGKGSSKSRSGLEMEIKSFTYRYKEITDKSNTQRKRRS